MVFALLLNMVGVIMDIVGVLHLYWSSPAFYGDFMPEQAEIQRGQGSALRWLFAGFPFSSSPR